MLSCFLLDSSSLFFFHLLSFCVSQSQISKRRIIAYSCDSDCSRSESYQGKWGAFCSIFSFWSQNKVKIKGSKNQRKGMVRIVRGSGRLGFQAMSSSAPTYTHWMNHCLQLYYKSWYPKIEKKSTSASKSQLLWVGPARYAWSQMRFTLPYTINTPRFYAVLHWVNGILRPGWRNKYGLVEKRSYNDYISFKSTLGQEVDTAFVMALVPWSKRMKTSWL